jgi:amidase
MSRLFKQKLVRRALGVVCTATAITAMVAGWPSPPAVGQTPVFQIEESTIRELHRAIQSGQTTCQAVVRAYIERAKAYNGTCTALVTKDGAPVTSGPGPIRAGAPVSYPSQSVPASKVFPDLDKYAGPPLEFGRMVKTISDPTVEAQYGMRVGIADAGQLNALTTLNIRGERSVTCKGDFDRAPSAGPLPAGAPAVCEEFRKLPDAMERAAELDKQFGRKPDLAKMPMYCVAFAWKTWYDAKDMRATGGNDVKYAMDVPKVDSTDVALLRDKGAISLAIANASNTGGPTARGGGSPKTPVTPDGNYGYGLWGGQPCNPYDTERVPRGTSSGSGVAVSANLAACSLCEQTNASCKGPASRNNVVNLLATKGVMGDGGPGYANAGDRTGVMCRTVADAVQVLDAAKGFKSHDMYTAIPMGIVPKEAYSTFVTGANHKPLKGMRLGVVREFMVKHVKNDEAISDQMDKEFKSVLRDKLGAELVESVDPLYPDDPSVPNMKYTFQDAFAEILPQTMPEYFWQKTPTGELEFAVPGHDVRTLKYALDLAMGVAPLSDKLNLRRVSSSLGTPRGSFYLDKYLRERGDTQIKDWVSFIANNQFKGASEREAAENYVASLKEVEQDVREPAGSISYIKMQAVFRMVVQKVMAENHIDAFVNPENTLPPYKIGYPAEPQVNNRTGHSCCGSFTALLGGPEIDVPAGYTRVDYEPHFVLSPDKTSYVAVSGTVATQLPHPMPISMMVWAAPGSDPAVIKVASAYESATHHRVPPPAFGPVAGKKPAKAAAGPRREPIEP